MIIGIGTDIIDIRRIRKVINKYGNRFKRKCFHESEIKKSDSRYNLVESYAKRYAAKEACAKALGTGFSNNKNFKNINIKNNKKGKPFININKKLKNKIFKKFKISKFKCFLSMSDEKNYSISFVIISGY